MILLISVVISLRISYNRSNSRNRERKDSFISQKFSGFVVCSRNNKFNPGTHSLPQIGWMNYFCRIFLFTKRFISCWRKTFQVGERVAEEAVKVCSAQFHYSQVISARFFVVSVCAISTCTCGARHFAQTSNFQSILEEKVCSHAATAPTLSKKFFLCRLLELQVAFVTSLILNFLA